jgi:hypothetical protein
MINVNLSRVGVMLCQTYAAFDTFGFAPGYPNDCLMRLAKFQASNRFT